MHVRLSRLLLLAPVFLATLAWPFDPASEASAAAQAQAKSGSYLFCFWNVENLFDDRNDKRGKADEPYDNWFARDKKALDLKLERLCSALLKMNGGNGPDILAVIEVESIRAAELLQQALNKRLKNPALHYKHILMKDLAAGRHIAPAIITRLPVKAERTRLHGRKQRILEGHVNLRGHDLVILATHWTSRITDDTGDSRKRYADEIHSVYQALHHANRHVDLLICGDFNDPPDAPSVTQHLHAHGSLKTEGKKGTQPRLLNLMAGKAPKEFGTHYYRGWWIFDQIVVSPGMLDTQGWHCDPKSIHVENTLHREGDTQQRPWRFGDEDDKGPRGYSDHFPVTLRLQVQAK